MTNDKLKERLAELDKERHQLLSNYNLLLGSMQECQAWLNKLDAQEVEVELAPSHCC